MKATALLFAFAVASSSFIDAACVTQDPAAKPKPRFVLEAGELQLSELIDRAATFLQWNILTSPREMDAGTPQSAKLQQRIDVDRDGCVDVLSGMLVRSGFLLTPIDEAKGLYEVIALNGPRMRDAIARATPRTPQEILSRPGLKMFVSTTVQLKNVNPVIATNSLRPFVASSSGNAAVSIGSIGGSGLLITGMQDQIAALLHQIEACDVPPPKIAADEVAHFEAIERRLRAIEEKLGIGQAK